MDAPPPTEVSSGVLRPAVWASSFVLGDAHNHLQDERFAGRQAELIAEARAAGVTRMAVNGSGEADWPLVAELARRHPEVIPSFGCHPWYLGERTDGWQDVLRRQLDEFPDAGVGEIGLDRWMLDQPERWRTYRGGALTLTAEPPAFAEQEAAFVGQLRLAAERNRPASIHCLQAFGRLRELLEQNPRPERGFLLHSYGGPAELVPAFARLGAYFGFPGYFLHERKARQREVFRHVPPDRLLVETDAPDQLPPDALIRQPLTDAAGGRALNHPANLAAIHRSLAGIFGQDEDLFAAQVSANFQRLFGDRPR